MEKLEPVEITATEWGNLVTKYRANSNNVSLNDFTDGTVNMDSDVTGDLTKRLGSVNYNPTPLSHPTKDLYEAVFQDGARNLLSVSNGEIKYSSGDNIFNTVVNGTGFSTGSNFEFITTQDRVYGGNAINAPIVYDRATSYGGVVYSAPRIKTMGAQAPTTAPTVAVVAGGNVPIGSHTYKITFLYYDAEESNGGPASAIATTSGGNQTVNLSAIPIGGYGVTARKIYRDNNDGLWLHVGTIANNTATTFADTLAVGVTPTEIPSLNDVPPPFGLITSWLDRAWLGQIPGDPFTLAYSETGQPDIVRPENRIFCNQEDPITGFVVYFDRLLVFNRRSMGQILGRTADTFEYSEIPSSVGCVDNRTIQIRVIRGVPVVLWLSDRGFYSYDGNSIDYISDVIEDLVNFNIQQAAQQRNLNAQTTQAQFQNGTASQGIDLVSIPDTITTKGYENGSSVVGTNPRRTWDDQGDWEGGTLTNAATKDGSDTLKRVPMRLYTAAEGTVSGSAIISGDQITFPQGGSQSIGNVPNTDSAGGSTINGLAQQLTITENGTITALTMYSFVAGATIPAMTLRVAIFSDASGTPGTELFGQNFAIPAQTVATTLSHSVSPNLSVTPGNYWFAIYVSSSALFSNAFVRRGSGAPTLSFLGGVRARVPSTNSWITYTDTLTTGPDVGQALKYVPFSWVFSQTPLPLSGTWQSPIYDTFGSTAPSQIPTPGTSYFNGQTLTLIVEGSDEITFSSGVVSQTFSNPSGLLLVSLSSKRYWRVRILLTTPDDRFSAVATLPLELRFPANGTWESEVIDCTDDVTTYNSLTTAFTGSITVTTQIATSTSPSGPWTFVTFGSHTVRRYVKILLTLQGALAQTITPVVTSVNFTWTLTSNFVSSVIDTAIAPPAGWDIFLAAYQTNGGTVQFQMRSGSTNDSNPTTGVLAATFANVTPGEFPATVPAYQYVQWKVIMTSSDNTVPTVDSVTIQWFISTVTSIRPASIFFNGRYYVALALLNQTTNTILLELDLNGKWRRHSGLAISTFSFFFNKPYFGSATTGYIRRFLEGSTDAGTNIEFDVRFRAHDFSTAYRRLATRPKVVGEAILHGTNTGASISVYYSIDEGETFYPLYTPTGGTSFTTSQDGQNFYVRFRPKWDGSAPVTGKTIMYRIYSNDQFPVEISQLDVVAFMRRQPPVITG